MSHVFIYSGWDKLVTNLNKKIYSNKNQFYQTYEVHSKKTLFKMPHFIYFFFQTKEKMANCFKNLLVNCRFKNLILRKFATPSFLFISVQTQIKGQISTEKTTIIASTFYVHFTKVNEDINFVKPSFVK